MCESSPGTGPGRDCGVFMPGDFRPHLDILLSCLGQPSGHPPLEQGWLEVQALPHSQKLLRALQFAHSQQNPPRSRSLLALPCQPARPCCCNTLRGFCSPFLTQLFRATSLPTLGSSPPRLSTSKLPSSKPGSFQTSWLYYIHLFTGTCQSLLFSFIPFPSWRGKGHPITGFRLTH